MSARPCAERSPLKNGVFQQTAALVCLVFLAACTERSGAPLLVTDVRVHRPLPGATVAAGYLAMTNTSRERISITNVTSPQYESVTIHETIARDGRSMMRPVARLDIAPGQTLELEPGGRHLMLAGPGPRADSVTLRFYSGGELLIELDAALAAMPH